MTPELLVAIDIRRETPIRMAKAARIVPPRRGERPTNPSTIYRWANTGIDGIRLEVIQIGGTLCTSVEALQRFFDSLGEARSAQKSTESSKLVRARRTASGPARLSKTILDEAGI